jgi:hypothetical protein
VDLKIEETIAATVRASIESHIQNINLDEIIAEHLQKQVSNVIINLTGKIFSQIVDKRDLESEVTALVNNILADQLMTLGHNKVSELLGTLDINAIVNAKSEAAANDAISTFKFPDSSIPFASLNLDTAQLPAAKLDSGIIPQFNSMGISDTATKTQLVVTDEGIVTTNNITAENLLIDDNAFFKNITVDGDFSVAGLDTFVKNIADETAAVYAAQSTKQDIDISDRNIVYGDRLILNHDTLGPQIINSNIRRLGNLQELSVEGQAIIHETLVVTNNKVGINTESAAGALSVWDEDAEFTLVKHSPRTMYAGSTRATDLIFGTNNQNQLKLKSNNSIELNGPLRFNGILINVVDRIPEQVGEPGEIAVMRDGTAIYRCQGQNSWGKIL